MARAFPRSRFTGFDISDAALSAARDEAAAMALTNARFLARDAASLGETSAFDFITTFDAVHDQARPDEMLAGIAKALRPGGTYLCVDFRASGDLAGNLDHPLGPFFYAISCMHCMTVSLADGGMGLGTMWGEQVATDMLHAAGFGSVEIAHVDGDITSTYYVCHREPGAA
jgi:SAM-dependent methyltransferase